MSKEFERIFPKILKKPGLFQISFEKAQKSPAKKPGLFWAGLFTLANPAVTNIMSSRRGMSHPQHLHRDDI